MTKRVREKLRISPDATRCAAAALPLDTSKQQQPDQDGDRTKIIKLGLIANRNRRPLPLTIAAHFFLLY